MFFTRFFKLFFIFLLIQTYHEISYSRSLIDIVEQSIIQEKQLMSENKPKEKEKTKTKVSIYSDGAVVNKLFKISDLKNGNEIDKLSSEVEENSIMLHYPDNVSLIGYQFIDDGVNDKKEEITKKSIILNIGDNLQQDALDPWRLQYVLNKIYWKANHTIEFSEDGEHLSFYTIIKITNHSGVDLKNIKVQFLDTQIKNKNEKTDKQSYSDFLIYKHNDICDIPSGIEKTLIWTSAKRISISPKSGLFIGGKYLEKMTDVAYPKIENWIKFPNSKGVGLGKPIPSGNVSIYFNKKGFSSLLGIAEIPQAKIGEDVMVPIPENKNNNDEHSFIIAQLAQDSFRQLTPAMSEAEYKLSIQNMKNAPTSLCVTINKEHNQKCSVARSNLKYERNENKEITWQIEIPAKGTKEIRYKLIVIKK